MSYLGVPPFGQTVRTITESLATAGQTTFSPSGGYLPGYIDVFLNGSALGAADFTATNGSTVVLNVAAALNDEFKAIAYWPVSLIDTYRKAEADALLAARVGTTSSVSMRNRIINGDMRIDQRNAGASVTPASNGPAYLLDRFAYYNSQVSKLTYQQNAGGVTPPAGFSNYLGVTVASAATVGSSDVFLLYQPIEGFNVSDLAWGTANAQSITISFWVRSSLTGNFSGALQNSGNTRTYAFPYSISQANTWERKTVTVNGDTAGTWLTNNGTGITINFSLGTGSSLSTTAGSWVAGNTPNATGSVNLVATAGATFYITGVQLEAGSVASPFERRDYGRELMMCQRYFAAVSGALSSVASTANIVRLSLPVSMRTSPTSVITTVTAGTGASYAAISSLLIGQAGVHSVDASANISVSAEL